MAPSKLTDYQGVNAWVTGASSGMGKHEITYPKRISPGYIVKALAPGFMRKQVKRVTLNAIQQSRD